MTDQLFTSNEFKEAWEEWLQYRKERKLSKYTPTGLKRTLTMLMNISDGDEKKAIAYIHFSIAQNYQGIYSDPNYGKKSINQGGTGQQQLTELLRNHYGGK